MNKRLNLIKRQREPKGANDFHPLSLIHNGITMKRCLQACSFCCSWHITKFFMVVIAVLLSLIVYALIISGASKIVNLPPVDNSQLFFRLPTGLPPFHRLQLLLHGGLGPLHARMVVGFILQRIRQALHVPAGFAEG